MKASEGEEHVGRVQAGGSVAVTVDWAEASLKVPTQVTMPVKPIVEATTLPCMYVWYAAFLVRHICSFHTQMHCHDLFVPLN